MAEGSPPVALNEALFVKMLAKGHTPTECPCPTCRRWRGDPIHIERVKKKDRLRYRPALYLTDETWERLVRMAKLEKISMSKLLRKALIDYLVIEERKRMMELKILEAQCRKDEEHLTESIAAMEGRTFTPFPMFISPIADLPFRGEK